MATEYLLQRGSESTAVTVLADRGDAVDVRIGDRTVTLAVARLPDGRWALADGDARRHLFRTFEERGERVVVAGCAQHRFMVEDARASWLRGGSGAKGGGGGRIKASMPGRVVRVPVAVGDTVTEGAVVAVLEAMKMENDVRAPIAGVVAEVGVSVGQAVEAGHLLVRLEPQS
jgi:biotin carboxyl carrier protein